MKVKVTMTFDIDPEAWNMTYGTGAKAADVRADVREHAFHTLTETYSNFGVLTEGNLA